MTITIEEYYAPLKRRLELDGVQGLGSDIDDTLAATNLSWARHHIIHFGNPEGLTAEEIIKKYRFVSWVPYWRNNSEAERWVLQRLETNEGRLDVPAMEGSLESMARIMAVTPLAAYLTGRPPYVLEGTQRWLRERGFPESEVVTHPPKKVLDEMGLSRGSQWKAKVLEYLYPQINGIIEDLPDIVTYLSPDYKGTVYLFATDHCERTSIDVVCCPTWEDVARSIEDKARRKT